MKKVYKAGCKATDKWIKDIDLLMTALNEKFSPLETVIYSGKQSKDLLPIKFIQQNRTLIIWRRDNYTPETFYELIKMFAFFVDDYYLKHERNYSNFLKSVGSLHTKIYNSQISGYIHDILDGTYQFIMSGKYADRHKGVKIDINALKPVKKEIQDAYNKFHNDPFRGILAAGLKKVLEYFYQVDLEIEVPDDQLTKIVLNRIGEISVKSVKSIGYTETYNEFLKIYNFSTPFIHSSINDLNFS